MGKIDSFYPSKDCRCPDSTLVMHSRGLVNGNGGRRPGEAAMGRGLINGNGLTNGNGLANSSTKIKIRDIVNCSGLVNGNGLTNGNGISCGDSQLKKRINGKGRKKRIAARVLVIAVLVIIPLVFVNFRSPYNEGNGIYIDGNLGDWKSIEGCDDASDDQIGNPSANIMNYRLFNYNEEERPWNSKLSFYLEVEGYIFGNPRPRPGNELTSYAVHIFIDSDCDPKTGYEIQGLGADFVIELEGHDGIVHTSDLLEFEGRHNPKDWNGFKKTGSISWALSDHVLETQIRSNPSFSSKFDVLFHVTDSRDNEDFSDTVVSNDKGRLILTSETAAPAILAIGARDVCLLELNLLAQDADIELEHLNVTINGNSEPSDIDEISLFIDDGDKIHTQSDLQIASASLLGRTAFLMPDEPVRVGMDNTTTLFVTATISSGAALYSVAGLSIASREDIAINKGTVTLHSDTSMSYIGAVPETVSIDGAFADWEGIYGHEDGDDLPIIKQNTDMKEYKVTADDGSLYFYLDVEGTIMGGTAVPMVPRYQSYSDIPVSKALPKKRAQDSSEGELQPQNDIPQELLGEDSIFIFVDSDQNASTGYSPVWLPMGAEHMVLVSGKDGEVLETSVMTFLGSPEDNSPAVLENPFLSKESGTGNVQWVARYEPEIEVETLSSELEARMGTGFLNAAESVDIFFVATNWNNNVIDTADSVIGETMEKNTGLRSNNPYISSHMHPDDADNSDGDVIDYLNLDEDAPGDGVYENSGDTNEPNADWIEVIFPSVGIPMGSEINNITYYYGYYTNAGWGLTTDSISNITWRTDVFQYNMTNYTLSAPPDTDIDASFTQFFNLPTSSALNSGSFTVRFRGLEDGGPSDNFYLDYCYFTINYSIPEIVINEISFNPSGNDNNSEWVELYNAGNTAIDLTGWNLTDNGGNRFSLSGAGTIPAKGYLIGHLGQTGTNSSTDVYGTLSETSLQSGPTDGKDAQIWGSNVNKDKNWGTSTNLIVKKSPTDPKRILVEFNLEGIPTNSIVKNATLQMYKYLGAGGVATISVHKLNHTWNEGSGDWIGNSAIINGTTWFERWYGDNANDGNDPWDEKDPDWASVGGDYDPIVEATATVGDNSKWINWTITNLAQKWVNNSEPNYGFILISDLNAEKNFYSSDYTGDSSLRPKLKLIYTLNTMLENDKDGLTLLDSAGKIIDYVAWGADVGTDDDGAVLAGQWDDGDYINISQLLEGQTLGRDRNSNDTDQPEDWQNATGYADPFGIDRSSVNGSTQGLQNWDGIPEFSEIVFPFAVILILFAVGRKKYKRLSKGEHRHPSHGLSKRSMINKRCEQ